MERTCRQRFFDWPYLKPGEEYAESSDMNPDYHRLSPEEVRLGENISNAGWYAVYRPAHRGSAYLPATHAGGEGVDAAAVPAGDTGVGEGVRRESIREETP